MGSVPKHHRRAEVFVAIGYTWESVGQFAAVVYLENGAHTKYRSAGVNRRHHQASQEFCHIPIPVLRKQ